MGILRGNIFCKKKSIQTGKAKKDKDGNIIYKRDKDGNIILKSKTEKHHKYEYPGIHQSLLWAVSAVKFYLTIKLNQVYSINKINSGYRCWEHEIPIILDA